MSYMKEFINRCEERGLDPGDWNEKIIAEIEAEREQAEQHRRMKQSMAAIHAMEESREQIDEPSEEVFFDDSNIEPDDEDENGEEEEDCLTSNVRSKHTFTCGILRMIAGILFQHN